MQMEERWYQQECSQALFAAIKNKDCHPIAVVPTAGGKTHILCLTIDLVLSDTPLSNILILSHVEEILEQDQDAIENYFDIDVGIYSASMGQKNIKKITIAGIQSCYDCPELFKHFDVIFIDECHLIPMRGNTMYRKFLGAIDNAVYAGLTATPFRLGHGYLHKGENALFTDIVYDLSSLENFNRLTAEGYLAKLITKCTELEFNTDDIRTTAGDFNLKDLSDNFDTSDITNAAVAEIVKYGKKYKKWLIFAIDIDHAEHINLVLNEVFKIPSVCVHSKMKIDRGQVIAQYKAGKYRAIVNVDVLTTGFNVPEVDLIGMLRPTQSPVIHVQTIGRGLRPAKGKDHCLVLDFAGNTERLGPINDVRVKEKGKGKGKGEPIVKKCPECECLFHPSVKVCDCCGHEFVFKTKLEANASTAAIVATEVTKPKTKKWFEVKDVTYMIHQRDGKPDSLKVNYNCGVTIFSEWVCLNHEGFAKHKARHWVAKRWPDNDVMPLTVGKLYADRDKLKKPFAIYVDVADKFPVILDSKFDY